MEFPRNMTGLYLGGFIQEGYLPPREKKSTIPSTFYRGHVVKLARAPNSNPHRSSVGRYPMHNLNSGFAGLTVPIKDQMNFKNPEDNIYERKKTRARGKWANYPMSIEIKKIAGSGTSGSYLAKCVLGENNIPMNENKDRRVGKFKVSTLPSDGRVTRSLFGIDSPDQRDTDEERFYQSMYDEIRQVVSGQENAMQSNQIRLQRILMNDSRTSIRPDVISPAHRNNRVSTSYGFTRRQNQPPVPRPHTTAQTSTGSNRCLLLPVPYVSKHSWKVGSSSAEPCNSPLVGFSRGATPFIPHLSAVSPFAKPHSIKAELQYKDYRDETVKWSSPEPIPDFHGNHSPSNISTSHLDRLNRLLSAAEKEGLPTETVQNTSANCISNVTTLLPNKDEPKKSRVEVTIKF